MLGYDNVPDNTSYEDWENQLHPDDLPKARLSLEAVVRGPGTSLRSEYRVRCKDGSWKWIRLRATVVARGADGRALRMTGLISDVSEKRRAEEIIWGHTNFDALTGMPNRRLFRDRLDLYPADARNSDDLVRNADQAMYAAKNSGRNQFSYFTAQMQKESHDRLRLINDLRIALHSDQLQVYYQPLVNLASGQIVKAEALVRWHHPRLGLLEPMMFIAHAEESGLINQIGDWVFMQAAACSREWGEKLGAPFQISVNKSPVQFLSRFDEMDWSAYLGNLGLSGASIAVEITEGVLLNASPGVISKLEHYRDAGIEVAIDDFGTGYSSMAYLKKFDIDYLKIDQSFIREMEQNSSDRAIVRSTIVMAHELGLKVIAEGIETPGQRKFLEFAGCDIGQGYLFSRPMPPAEFERSLVAPEVLRANVP
jgi:EAL domain-containing protein (putative c-di-GMP-specific phosphodiesterase class I)